MPDRPAYLTGERLYLRALRQEDAAVATAWHPGPLPINAPAAAAFLKEQHTAAWWASDPLYLAIARVEDDEVVGGVEIKHPQRPAVGLRLRAASVLSPAAADAVLADALRLLIPWLRDEVEAMVVTVPIPADCPATLAAATALGMVQGTRLRQFVARAGEVRVDLLEYQALNPRWVVPSDDGI